MTTWAAAPPTRGEPPAKPLVVVGLTAGIAALAAIAVGQLSVKLALVAAGLFVLVLGLFLVANRPLFVLLLLVMTLQFMLYKSVGPIDQIDIGGAPSIYITTLDVWLVVLYGLWFFEGTLFADLRAAVIWGIAWIPMILVVPGILSLLTASNLYLSAAELVRMGWMAALFLYVALRLRTRHDVVVVIGALGVVVVIQAVVAALQWRTHSSLGLSLLGEENTLYVRNTLDLGAVPRASGTVIHPDFLAALVAPVGLIALSLAINLRRRLHRLLCLALAAIAVAPLAASGARAAIAGAAAGAGLLVVAYLLRGRLRPAWVLATAALVSVPALLLSSRLQEWFQTGTTHFQLEVDSRLQLNGLALNMFQSSPIVGIGLNNFQAVFGHFDQFGLVLAGYPVHNLYLLVLAETGLLGLLALLVVGAVLFRVTIRVSRAADPLLAAVGIGIAASFVFFAVEEVPTFSLREEMPLALFWLLAGLAMAASRLVPGRR